MYDRKFGWTANCCAKSHAEGLIQWTKGDSSQGPEYDGFAVQTGSTGDCFVAVTYCPFCGKTLMKPEHLQR